MRNAANAVPAASARGRRFALVAALSLSRPEKTLDRTMLSAHAILSGVTDSRVPGECFCRSSMASSFSFRCASAALTAGGYWSSLSSSSVHSERRSKSFGSWEMYG